jgi:GTP-binding protein LepA
LEITDTIDKRHMVSRTLDSMDLEREKGITIKLKAVRMKHTYEDKEYQLNLIDTPGHVDFSYEVSRSLAACDGAILVVDVSQGIQAQTVSNIYKAQEANLKLIPVLNKIDLPGAQVEKVTEDLIRSFGFSREEILSVSAKTGEGVEILLDEVIRKVPPPSGNPDAESRALVFDSFYDEYLGVIAAVNVVDGNFSEKITKNREKIKLLATKFTSIPEEIGIFTPSRKKVSKLETGEVGYVATGLKDIHAVKVGDTVSLESQNPTPLPGYKEVKPFVFVSIYPIENDKFPQLREALEKLSLSDSSLSFDPETNSALGFGFRCGFLGLLHADIIQERLEREYNLDLISTTPTVEYQIELTNKEIVHIKNPADFPDRSRVKTVLEPYIMLKMISPKEYTGKIILNMNYL